MHSSTIPTCVRLRLLACGCALALAAAMLGCELPETPKPPDKIQPFEMTWYQGVILSPPYIDYALTGNPLFGAFREDDAHVGAGAENVLVFERDGTFQRVETIQYESGYWAGCKEVTIWRGTFSGADPAGQGQLTLSSKEPGTVTRSSCEDATRNGTSVADTSPDGTYTFTTLYELENDYELHLTRPGANPDGWTYSRVDVGQSSAELAFHEDGSFNLTEVVDYAPDGLRLAGCHEVLVQVGQHAETGEGDGLNLTLSGSKPATITRSSCARKEDEGTFETPAAEALGPLSGKHRAHVERDVDGSHALWITLASDLSRWYVELLDYQYVANRDL